MRRRQKEWLDEAKYADKVKELYKNKRAEGIISKIEIDSDYTLIKEDKKALFSFLTGKGWNLKEIEEKGLDLSILENDLIKRIDESEFIHLANEGREFQKMNAPIREADSGDYVKFYCCGDPVLIGTILEVLDRDLARISGDPLFEDERENAIGFLKGQGWDKSLVVDWNREKQIAATLRRELEEKAFSELQKEAS